MEKLAEKWVGYYKEPNYEKLCTHVNMHMHACAHTNLYIVYFS